MYYILIVSIALLIFVLFIKALGAVIKGILTTLFVLLVIASIFIMYKSLQGPVDIFGIYKVEQFEIAKYGD